MRYKKMDTRKTFLFVSAARTAAFFALAAGTALCAGCATIFTGTRQDVDIDSQPSGAEVFVNGDFVGKTPLTLSLLREEPPLLVLKEEGYADTRVQIERGGNGGLAANALLLPFPPVLGMLFGLGFDFRAGTEDAFKETDIVVPLFLHDERADITLYDGHVRISNISPKSAVPAETETNSSEENEN